VARGKEAPQRFVGFDGYRGVGVVEIGQVEVGDLGQRRHQRPRLSQHPIVLLLFPIQDPNLISVWLG